MTSGHGHGQHGHDSHSHNAHGNGHEEKEESHSERDLEEIAYHVSDPTITAKAKEIQNGLKHAYHAAAMDVLGALSDNRKEARGIDKSANLFNDEKLLSEKEAIKLADEIFLKTLEHHAKMVKKDFQKQGIERTPVEERHLEDFKELKERFENRDYHGIHEKSDLLDRLDMMRNIISQNYTGLNWKGMKDALKGGFNESHRDHFAEQAGKVYAGKHQEKYLRLLTDRESIVNKYFMKKDDRFNDKSLKTKSMDELKKLFSSVASLDYHHGDHRQAFKKDIEDQYSGEFKSTAKLAKIIDLHEARKEKEKRGYHPPGSHAEGHGHAGHGHAEGHDHHYSHAA